MSTDRFLVTGAMGCIGAWTVRNLVKAGVQVATLDQTQNFKRLGLLLTPEEIAQVQVWKGDVSNLGDVRAIFEAAQPTHVIHLAALQLPFCKADPVRGAQVNVVGTVNIFEVAKEFGLKKLVFASTTAVYGTADEYDPGPLSHDTPLKPRSHYGVYKQANEGTARVYWLEDGISSIGLRPYTVYGAGRDQGMTSTPTKAMLAAALGHPYHISFGGRCAFQYGDDTGKIFIQAALTDFQGAETFNIGGESNSVAEVIAAIEKAAPEMRGQITFNDVPLPFPEEADNQALSAVLGPLPFTPLEQGVADTIQIFRHALSNGQMSENEANIILS